tara:strand:- start:7434 stop:8000 length:567 start_codon:yes stop_codon:yes gene_type:complete
LTYDSPTRIEGRADESEQERNRVEVLEPRNGEPSDLPTHRLKVEPAWIDTNNHMNAAYYTVAVKDAALYAHDAWDYGDDFRIRTGESNFVVDTQVIYLRELLLGAGLLVRTRILSVEEKRMSLLFEIFNDELDYLAALVRYRVIHVRLGPPPRAAAIPSPLRRRLEMVRESHAKLPLPPGHERFRSSF